MLRIFLDTIEEGLSHVDLTAEASDLTSGFEGGHLVSPVTASLEISRTGNEIVITGTVSVKAVLECARCLDEFVMDLESPIEIVCMVGAGSKAELPEREGVIELPSSAGYVDLTDETRSSLLVLLPLKPLCSPNCQGLCPRCGTNLNRGTCSCAREDYDSRWDALKRFKENL